MKEDLEIAIVGAGIGGLTTAIALKQKGYRVTVYEQSSELKEVGAGIILSNNAMQVYQHLGLSDQLTDAGNVIRRLRITKENLAPLSTVDLGYFEQKYGVTNIAIHRGKLQMILFDQLRNDVACGKRLQTLTDNHGSYVLNFEDGTSTNADLVIGADGINSTVRHCMFPDVTIRDARQRCWRGVTSFVLPEQYRNEFNEAWGHGDRVGFGQISPEHCYWFALKKETTANAKITNDNLASHFQNYAPLIRQLISSTPSDTIHSASITDIKPNKEWVNGKVCLIGDAAHATTPNMGQGACQSIEDAYTLAECMDAYEPEEALVTFKDLRLPKAHHVVKTSWTIGHIAHWQNPIATRVRNSLMAVTPAVVARRQSDRIFELSGAR